MRLSDDDIAAIVLREIQQAAGYQTDTLDSKRKAALDAYYGLTPEAVDNRSSIVSTDVADGVHAVLAQITPVLKSTIIEFVPNGQDDEAQAQAETDFVRNQVEKAGGYRGLFESVHDALLIANGWLKVVADTDRTVEEAIYPPDLTDEELMVISEVPGAVDVQVTSSKDKTTVRATFEKKILSIKSVPPEVMLFSESGAGFSLEELRFVGERMLMTANQLREYGIAESLIAEIPDATDDYWSAQQARLGIYAQETEMQSVQDAERLKEIYCCYVRLSVNDNDTSELRYVWIGGTELLKNEPADYIPYITGSAVPVPHRIQGTGLYELLGSVQNGKTHILRQYMDNLSVMNSSRIGAVEGQVNMKDLTTGRINGVVRLRSPDAIVPMPAADIGQQAMAGLGYLDQVATSRIGSSVDFNEIQNQLMSTSATAAAGQLAKVEQMGGWFASNIAQTMLMPLFKLVHHVMRTEFDEPIMARIQGKWQETVPAQWPERDATDVNMGMTTTDRAMRTNALNQVIAQQQQMIQSGGDGIITDQSRLYAAMSDWIRSNDLGDPTQYLIDPASEESQQAAQQAQQAQEQQQAEMQQMQEQMIKMQQDFELKLKEMEIQWKYYDTDKDAESKEADITAKSIVELKKVGAKSA